MLHNVTTADGRMLDRADAGEIIQTDTQVTVRGTAIYTVATWGPLTVAAGAAPGAPLDDLKASALTQLETIYADKVSSPFSWDFGALHGIADDGSTISNVGVRTLQLRGLQDQANWEVANQSAILAVFGGAPTTIIPLRTSDNVWVQTPASTVLHVLAQGDGTQQGMFGRQLACLARKGQLKSAIEGAVDAASLPDLTTGWP